MGCWPPAPPLPLPCQKNCRDSKCAEVNRPAVRPRAVLLPVVLGREDDAEAHRVFFAATDDADARAVVATDLKGRERKGPVAETVPPRRGSARGPTPRNISFRPQKEKKKGEEPLKVAAMRRMGIVRTSEYIVVVSTQMLARSRTLASFFPFSSFLSSIVQTEAVEHSRVSSG